MRACWWVFLSRLRPFVASVAAWQPCAAAIPDVSVPTSMAWSDVPRAAMAPFSRAAVVLHAPCALWRGPAPWNVSAVRGLAAGLADALHCDAAYAALAAERAALGLCETRLRHVARVAARLAARLEACGGALL